MRTLTTALIAVLLLSPVAIGQERAKKTCLFNFSRTIRSDENWRASQAEQDRRIEGILNRQFELVKGLAESKGWQKGYEQGLKFKLEDPGNQPKYAPPTQPKIDIDITNPGPNPAYTPPTAPKKDIDITQPKQPIKIPVKGEIDLGIRNPGATPQFGMQETSGYQRGYSTGRRTGYLLRRRAVYRSR